MEQRQTFQLQAEITKIFFSSFFHIDQNIFLKKKKAFHDGYFVGLGQCAG